MFQKSANILFRTRKIRGHLEIPALEIPRTRPSIKNTIVTRLIEMKVEFLVENVKCGGCASAIQTGLSQDARVKEVMVDVPTGRVSVETEGDIGAELRAALQALGYPEKTA